MQPRTLGRWLALLVALLLGPAGCGKASGTFVKLSFTGTVNQDQPIASIVLDLKLGGRTQTTSFGPSTGTRIVLPTDAVLEIGSGAGPLDVSARALAGDGGVLGTGTGTGTVIQGQTSPVEVRFGALADAGPDGPGAIDTQARPDTTLDTTFDLHADQGGALDLPSPLDAPAADAPSTMDQGAEPADAAADLPIDAPGTGGAGGSDGAPTGGAGGTGGTGGAGGTGSGGSSGGYLLVVKPPALDFGIVAPGSSSPAQSFTIVNQGTLPTPALATEIGDSVHFPFFKDGCRGVPLAPAGSCLVSFTFNPSQSGTVRAEGSVGPAGGTPAKFTVSGTGSGGAASLSLAPSTPSFPVVDVNQTTSLPMTLTNGGDGDAGTISLSLTGSPPFKITNNLCSGLPLAKSSQCTFTLSFSPAVYGPASSTVSAQSSTGLTASATATGTGRDVVPLTIAFAGTGGGVVNGGPSPCPSGSPCTFNVQRTDPASIPTFTLTAPPNALSVFGGWGGACTGTGPCTVVMDLPRSVTATFNPRMVPISLTVLGIAGGAGALVADDGSISCSGSCPNLSHAATNTFTLNVKTTSGDFIGWTSGPCKGSATPCTFALTDPQAITATFGPLAYMFVSSSTVVPGALGDITGGDKECQRLADQAGLKGTYVAWLSTAGTDARKRVGEGGWVRTDGRPFARSLKTLTDSSVTGYPTVYYPPRLDETGADFGNRPLLVATGGATDGTALGVQCGDYGKPVGDLYVGDATSGSFAWSNTQLVTNGCSGSFHLYCFRQDLAIEITPPPQTGRRIFTTAKPYLVGSIMTPTVTCTKEADAAGIPTAKSFVAFLATSTGPAGKLLGSTGPWMRADQVVVAYQPLDLINGRLLAPVNLTADGSTYLDSRVWTGAADPTVVGTATCGDWTTSPSIAPALVGDSRTTAAPNWFSLGTASARACTDATTHLLCVEP